MKPYLATYDLFLQGSVALTQMKHNGVRIDVDYLDKAISDTAEKAAEIEDRLKNHKIYTLLVKRYGKSINLDSTQQIGEVLFDDMKIPYKGEKTKTGKYKVDEHVLGNINHPWVKDYLYRKKLNNARNTFLSRIRRESIDGFLHVGNSLNTARTYRSSSEFHNFPSRESEFAETVRTGFIPREGGHIVECDFSAHEFRIAACFWKDPAMLEYATDPSKDIHRDQAADVYMAPTGWITKELRYYGKNKNVFPTLYGSWYGSMAPALWEGRHLKFTNGIKVGDHLRSKGIKKLGECEYDQEPKKGTYEKHVQECEQRFMKRFPIFAKGKDDFYWDYRQNCTFQMMTGFVVRGVHARNKIMNYPVQGPAFHCLLWCLIRLQKELRKRKMRTLLVMQIHDCLIADVPEDELQEYLHLVKTIVTVDLRKSWDWIIIPLEIEAEVSPLNGNWFQKAEWIENSKGVWIPKPRKVA